MSATADGTVRVLELRDVTVRFERTGDTPLVIAESLDLELAPGAFHCFVGRSGSGQTTLLKVASATRAPDGGEVLWSGFPTKRLSSKALARARREHMGYVDQGASCIGELRVIDNVLLPAMAGVRTVPPRHVEAAHGLLETLGIAQHAERRAERLSTGERQRMAIASALLLRPSVVCLDEPTASLDRTNARHVIETLVELARDGTAVLVASHDHELVEAARSRTLMD